MKIEVNGTRCNVEATTLAALLIEQGYGDATVATALNGDFIAQGQRDTTPIEAGDSVEILAPMQGG